MRNTSIDVLRGRWNDAVELAYIQDRAFDLQKAWQALKDNPENKSDFPEDEMWQIEVDMSKIESSRSKDALFGATGRHGRHMWYTPEPYATLARQVSDYQFALTSDWIHYEDGPNVEEVSEKLQDAFIKSVGDLIGRDTYIEGMNPHEFRDKAEQTAA